MFDRIERDRGNDAVRAILKEASANAAPNPGYLPRSRVAVQPGGRLRGLPLPAAEAPLMSAL